MRLILAVQCVRSKLKFISNLVNLVKSLLDDDNDDDNSGSDVDDNVNDDADDDDKDGDDNDDDQRWRVDISSLVSLLQAAVTSTNTLQRVRVLILGKYKSNAMKT